MSKPWNSREHRSADALIELCALSETVEPPVAAVKPLLVVEVPLSGPAEIAGVPLSDAMVEQLRANAALEPVLVDDGGLPVTIGTRASGLSPKLTRAILLRDGHCRLCERRHGLEVHHLVPRSWGGNDDPSNLATVCTGGGGHHRMLVPHGPWALVGNPNLPDGLRLVPRRELEARLAADRARAGPLVA